MTDWQERITAGTPPAIRTEHDVRYGLAASLVAGSATWCDLGCGNGIAAASALGESRPSRVVLVDLDGKAVEAAQSELSVRDAVGVPGDLTDADVLNSVREALLEGDKDRVITAFEVVEHLSTFVPLLELLSDLAEQGEATVVLSVPNDAFWAIENPHHQAMWSEGSFEELRRLLPGEPVVLHQVALQGSAVVPAKDSAMHDLNVAVRGDQVPTHMIVAFGPRATEVKGMAAVTQVDLDGQRAWERQREADTELMPELVETVRRQSKEFDDWRKYIHELEEKLGIPKSGTPEREAWDAGQS